MLLSEQRSKINILSLSALHCFSAERQTRRIDICQGFSSFHKKLLVAIETPGSEIKKGSVQENIFFVIICSSKQPMCFQPKRKSSYFCAVSLPHLLRLTHFSNFYMHSVIFFFQTRIKSAVVENKDMKYKSTSICGILSKRNVFHCNEQMNHLKAAGSHFCHKHKILVSYSDSCKFDLI